MISPTTHGKKTPRIPYVIRYTVFLLQNKTPSHIVYATNNRNLCLILLNAFLVSTYLRNFQVAHNILNDNL